jgi:hypothetical protein
VGVDLLPSAGGHVVLELNGAVEFDRGYDIAGNDVFSAVAEALRLGAMRRTDSARRSPRTRPATAA